MRRIRFNPEMTPSAGVRSGMDVEAHKRLASSRGSTGISRAGPCWMDVYVDGVLVQSTGMLNGAMNLDQVPITNVIGMEVYHPSEIPPEYRSGSTSACGVVMIWTRRS